MRAQLFQSCSIKRGDQFVRGVSVACGKCPHIGKVHTGQMKGFSQDLDVRQQQLTQRKFESQGWFIGGTTGQHRCPTCYGVERAARAAAKPPVKFYRDIIPQPKEITTMVAHAPAIAPKQSLAPPPKSMGREDRRIIFEKLNEVYADEKTGYSESWTDKRVAEDLGVPLAWVSTVREEMFGPVSSNPELDDKIAKAREVVADGRKLLTEVNELKSQIDLAQERINRVVAQTAPLLELVVRTERTMHDLSKTVRP